jgi:hypothetical protein
LRVPGSLVTESSVAGEVSPGLSVVIAVRDRASLLASSLPRWAAEAAVDEIVVVDFGSERPLVQQGVLSVRKVVAVRGGEGAPWAKGLAINLGVSVARHDTVLVADAADRLQEIEGYRDAIARQGGYLTGFAAGGGLPAGLAMFRRADWESLGGYHEYLLGWGFEGEDLFNRLEDTGRRHRFFRAEAFEATGRDVMAAGDPEGLALPERLGRHPLFQHDRNKVVAGLVPWSAAMPALRPRRFGRLGERSFSCDLAPAPALERQIQDCASYLAARFLHDVDEEVAHPLVQRLLDDRHRDYAARAARQHQIDLAITAAADQTTAR